MAENSKISWTHHTFNPWRGCSKVSAGCKFCYADTLSSRNTAVLGEWGKCGTRVIAAESYWRKPLAWNKQAEKLGTRFRVFCASLADVFEGRETMPEIAWNAVEAARERLWALIQATPHLDWLLLTKRPENIMQMVPLQWVSNGFFPDNVWVGTSVENQQAANERIPNLLKVPAKVRFLSVEPLLDGVRLREIPDAKGKETAKNHFRGNVDFPGLHFMIDCLTGIDYQLSNVFGGDIPDIEYFGQKEPRVNWVIIGGESGTDRAMPIDVARQLIADCQVCEVPIWIKQDSGPKQGLQGRFTDEEFALKQLPI